MKTFKEYLKESYEWSTISQKNGIGGTNIKYSIKNNLEEIAYIKTTEPIEENQTWIQALYVAPQYRRKGLAKQLVNHVIKLRTTPLYLRATPYKDEPLSEDNLISFYQSLGFKPINHLNKVYLKYDIN